MHEAPKPSRPLAARGSRHWVAGVLSLAVLAPVGRSDAAEVRSFLLTERFGVSHPSRSSTSIGRASEPGAIMPRRSDGGRPVPAPRRRQEARRAHRPSGVAEKRWTLVRGRAPAPATNGVTVAETAECMRSRTG